MGGCARTKLSTSSGLWKGDDPSPFAAPIAGDDAIIDDHAGEFRAEDPSTGQRVVRDDHAVGDDWRSVEAVDRTTITLVPVPNGEPLESGFGAFSALERESPPHELTVDDGLPGTVVGFENDGFSSEIEILVFLSGIDSIGYEHGISS